jgi:hypothetical protein
VPFSICDSGVRNKAEYRSLTEFTDKDLHSDYHFLTDVERVADNAHREAYKAKLMLRPELPNHLKNLVRQASFRAVALQIMPATLKRRKQNTTYFNHKDKNLLWRIEFIFHMDGAIILAQDRVPDKMLLSQVFPPPPAPADKPRLTVLFITESSLDLKGAHIYILPPCRVLLRVCLLGAWEIHRCRPRLGKRDHETTTCCHVQSRVRQPRSFDSC